MSRLRLLITVIVLLAFAACGGASRAPAPRLPADTAERLSALACPAGVDAGLWAELKGALEEALCCRAGTCAPPSGLSARSISGAPQVRALQKNISAPPTGEANQVNDLGMADNGDGTFTLAWHYRNLGDYDQNGVVALEDIYPLAEHFGENVPEEDAERNSLAAVIDGSGNGKVDIADITPIAQHYQTTVQRYVIEGAEAQSGPWAAVGEVAQDAGTGDGRLEYSSIVQSPAALWHRVVAYDAEGNPGEPSNAVLRPSNEPVIYEVTRTSGYQHEECTFTAVVSGAVPLAYAWDFGGGATPNTSSEISPTVTLADASEYQASLTISNSYGPTTFPFTLTVCARDTWAHTWGGGGRDEPMGIVVDSEGMIYIIGYGPSFGAVLLKCDPGGNLLCARTWGGLSTRSGAVDLSLAGDGSIYIVGTTENYGPGEVSSALITKFDANCNLQWARAWGGPWRTMGSRVVATPGGCYVAGRRSEEAYALDNLFVLRLDNEGNLLQQKAWRPNGIVSVNVAEGAADGSLYFAGGLFNAAMTDLDALLVKYDANLNFQWARQWGGEGDDLFRDLELLDDGKVLVAGSTESYNPELGQALLATFAPNGEPDEAWLYSTPLGSLAWYSLDVMGDRWCLGGTGLSDYWGALAVQTTSAFSVRDACLLDGGGVGYPYVAYSPLGDIYLFTNAWDPSWLWSPSATVTKSQTGGAVGEPQGDSADWDGTFVELDIEATVPDGRIDGYDPYSHQGELLLMKNFPEDG